MAKQRNGYFKGTRGNASYYERLGGYYIRSKPTKVKQTRATKASAGKFGKANSLSGSLRKSLTPVLPYPSDRDLMYRFTDALYHWLLLHRSLRSLSPSVDLPFVNGLQLNAHTSIGQRWKVPVSVHQPAANSINVHLPAFIPAQSIAAPAHTVAVTCIISAAGSMLNGTSTGSCTIAIEIPYNDQPIPAQVINLAVATPAGAVLVTAVALRYRLKNGKYCSRPSFLPASVMDARYC